jgi:hypothetical protein
VHKEISEYKTATVGAYHLNVTARACRIPLNKVFKQFSLIFAIKQSNKKLMLSLLPLVYFGFIYKCLNYKYFCALYI